MEHMDMSPRLVCLVSILAAMPLVASGEKKDELRYGASPLKGDYYVYGGTLAEMTPPAPRDRKVAFMFKGPLAKDLFNQIGPDVKKEDACSSVPDYRERRRGDLNCVFTKDDGYSCYFGLDVPTGKSTHGTIC
jgi:hypothetical protein